MRGQGIASQHRSAIVGWHTNLYVLVTDNFTHHVRLSGQTAPPSPDDLVEDRFADASEDTSETLLKLCQTITRTWMRITRTAISVQSVNSSLGSSWMALCMFGRRQMYFTKEQCQQCFVLSSLVAACRRIGQAFLNCFQGGRHSPAFFVNV